jgi:hypothetical protein
MDLIKAYGSFSLSFTFNINYKLKFNDIFFLIVEMKKIKAKVIKRFKINNEFISF